MILTPEELSLGRPGPSRTIEVTDFVELSEIDPIYFDKPYFLAPHGKNGDRAYELLRKVMAETNKVAIATFVMRDKQYLVAVRPEKSALVLETLLFADEVRDPVKEIDVLPVQASFEAREIEMAKLLIDSMTTPWQPESYHDTYRERVEELIDQKRQGTVVVSEGPRTEPAPVVDLLAALQASVSAARGRTGASASAEDQRIQKPTERTNRSRPRVRAAQTLGASRAELVRQAADLGIAGRSRMRRESSSRRSPICPAVGAARHHDACSQPPARGRRPVGPAGMTKRRFCGQRRQRAPLSSSPVGFVPEQTCEAHDQGRRCEEGAIEHQAARRLRSMKAVPIAISSRRPAALSMPTTGPLVDSFGRVHTDLRISVTDRCNLRCVYCMPEEGVTWVPRSEILTFEEIERIALVAHDLGVDSVRLTGGEPLVRASVTDLVTRLGRIGFSDLSMTTNGSGLARHGVGARRGRSHAASTSAVTR